MKKKPKIMTVLELDSRTEYTKNGKKYERLIFKPSPKQAEKKAFYKYPKNEKEIRAFVDKVGLPLFIELTKIDNQQWDKEIERNRKKLLIKGLPTEYKCEFKGKLLKKQNDKQN